MAVPERLEVLVAGEVLSTVIPKRSEVCICIVRTFARFLLAW